MRNKTLEDQLELIDTTSAWELWRTVEPRFLSECSSILRQLHRRLEPAMKAICRIHPQLTEDVQAILDSKFETLPKLLASLPADPAEETARFDMRMTIVLYSWVMGVCADLPPGRLNPLAPTMLARGLMLFADGLQAPAVVQSNRPRHERSWEERQTVADWKRHRETLRAMAESWIRLDPLAAAFEVLPDYEARVCYRAAAAILSAAGDLSDTGATREALEKEDLARGSGSVLPDLPAIEKDQPGKGVAMLSVLRGYVPKEELKRQGWDRLAEPVPLLGNGSNEVVRALAREFPWMEDVVDHIRRDLSLQRLRKDASSAIRIRPLLLLGAPGTGKSRFARRFAELAGLPMRTIGCGGTSDNRDLAGTSKGWSTGEPSSVLRAIRDGNCANPVILVDEVEKAGLSRHNGRIVDTLLAMLEPETARGWYDEYLCTAADLSAVNWILSANCLAGLPEPLLNRVTIVRVKSPNAEQLSVIFDSLKSDIAKELGVDPFALPEIHPEAERMLEHAFAEGQSIRRIRAALLAAIGASVDGPRMLH
ncbi:AAA family ATPase [Nisaea sp.]|uniref:AAA family ATPase n=1 Tax=Nisaea sp. TaxID=2024842 RepID=UPI003B527B25